MAFQLLAFHTAESQSWGRGHKEPHRDAESLCWWGEDNKNRSSLPQGYKVNVLTAMAAFLSSFSQVLPGAIHTEGSLFRDLVLDRSKGMRAQKKGVC